MLMLCVFVDGKANVGPRVLRFLEMPVKAVDVEEEKVIGSSSGMSRKRKPEK